MGDGKKRLVLVEDDPHIVSLVTFVLRESPLEIESFDNGAAGLARLMDGPRPDVVLLDVMLPEVNGLSILEAMKASPERRSVPVVVMSASSREGDRAGAEERGCDAFVPKPFDFAELQRILEELSGAASS